MGIGPVPAVPSLMKRTGTKIDGYDAIELNEAFAAQVIACDRDLHFDRERLNPNGGAIAIGHPVACTGVLPLCVCLAEWAWRSKSKPSKLFRVGYGDRPSESAGLWVVTNITEYSNALK